MRIFQFFFELPIRQFPIVCTWKTTKTKLHNALQFFLSKKQNGKPSPFSDSRYMTSLGNCLKGRKKKNWKILIWCSPDTEIFSKRRKIYSLCVESMSCQPKCVKIKVCTYVYLHPCLCHNLFHNITCFKSLSESLKICLPVA